MKTLTAASAMFAALFVPQQLTAAPLLINGGFESGFSGWTRVDQVGSDGTFMLQTGTTSPVSFESVPPPPEGMTAAMSDQQGPGSHVLYQDFVVPAGTTSGTLEFDLFIGNRAEAFFTPNSLDFATPTLNQQARVDLLLAASDPFTLNASDVLLNVYRTQVGDPLVSGYNTITVDISTLLALHQSNTLRLRFAEVDNVFLFQLGVDNVRIESDIQAIPEPTSVLLLGSGLVGLTVRRRLTSRPTGARGCDTRS
jgi:hypothetical protein